MASYQQSPQDEGYSEDPLTVGTLSEAMEVMNQPVSLQSMTISERTGRFPEARIQCLLTLNPQNMS
jgi:hypothetical protein